MMPASEANANPECFICLEIIKKETYWFYLFLGSLQLCINHNSLCGMESGGLAANVARSSTGVI